MSKKAVKQYIDELMPVWERRSIIVLLTINILVGMAVFILRSL